MGEAQNVPYVVRLRRHPGLKTAAGMTLLFLIAGKDTMRGLMGALVVSAFMWAIVLWTARSQP